MSMAPLLLLPNLFSKPKPQPPSHPIFSPSKTAPSEEPTGFELKPPRPENNPCLEISNLQNTGQYEELVSNRWNYSRKRSIIMPRPLPSIARIPAVLTNTPIGDQEPLMKAQQSGGQYISPYFQGLLLVVFIFFIMSLVGFAVMWAMAMIKRKMRCPMAPRLG